MVDYGCLFPKDELKDEVLVLERCKPYDNLESGIVEPKLKGPSIFCFKGAFYLEHDKQSLQTEMN